MNRHAKFLDGVAPLQSLLAPKERTIIGFESLTVGKQGPPSQAVPPRPPEPESPSDMERALKDWIALADKYRHAKKVVEQGEQEHERLKKALTAAERRLKEVQETVDALRAEYGAYDMDFSGALWTLHDPVYARAEEVLENMRRQLRMEDQKQKEHQKK